MATTQDKPGREELIGLARELGIPEGFIEEAVEEAEGDAHPREFLADLVDKLAKERAQAKEAPPVASARASTSEQLTEETDAAKPRGRRRRTATKKEASSSSPAGAASSSSPAGATLAERQTEIQANDLTPGQACPFTPDCDGLVRVYASVSREFKDPETGQKGKRIMQSLHCPACRRLPVNPRIVLQYIGGLQRRR